MRKSFSKLLTAALVLVLVVASITALAATRQVKILDGYEQNDSKTHYAIYTIMEGEATEDGGIRSGKPVGEEKVAEPHSFDSDGYCTKCGYYDDEDEPEPTTKPEPETTVAPVPVNPEDDDGDDDTTEGGTTEGGEDTTTTTTTFTTVPGITVTAGTPAAETLKQVITAIPADTEISFKDVDAEVGEALVAAINRGATVEELLEILAKFPQQIVDGTPCYVVTIIYTDAAGKSVVENYAFSTDNATLVKVF